MKKEQYHLEDTMGRMYKAIIVPVLLICLLGSSVDGKSVASFIYIHFHNWLPFSPKESVYELIVSIIYVFICMYMTLICDNSVTIQN